MFVIYIEANSSYLPIPAEAAPGEAPFVQLDRSSSLTGLDPVALRPSPKVPSDVEGLRTFGEAEWACRRRSGVGA